MAVSLRGVVIRRHFYRLSALWVLFFLVVFMPLHIHADDAPMVIINEVMWDGVEYVELFSTRDERVSLEGWSLQHQRPGKNVETLLTFSSDHSVEAEGYFLIEKQEAATSVEGNFVSSKLSLLNSGEALTLVNAQGHIIDTANWLGEWFAGKNTENGMAMERAADAFDGSKKESWQTSAASGGGRDGTPGAANSEGQKNTPPQSALMWEGDLEIGSLLTFSAEDSFDAEGDTLSYTWDFGDGAKGEGVTVGHAYAKAGVFEARVQVSDGKETVEAALILEIEAPNYSDEVVISEFVSDPTGSDALLEFIEVYNGGSEAVNLAGWKLDDSEGGSSPYVFEAGTSLLPHSYLVRYRSQTKLALNNNDDSVRLLTPAGEVRSVFSYQDGSGEGESYNRISDSVWQVSTQATPGAANVIIVPVRDSEKNEQTATASTQRTSTTAGEVVGAQVRRIALKDVRSRGEEEIIETEGVVSAPPGVLGKGIVYLAGSGVQVYASGGEYPDLPVGTRVRVVAETASYQGEMRLKLLNTSDLTVLAQGEAPTPHVLPTGKIDAASEGWLVATRGKVVETSGDTFYIDDGSGRVKVFVKDSTGIDKPAMEKGITVGVVGVVSRTRTGLRLLPRFPEDITVGMVAGLTHFPATGIRRIDVVIFLAFVLLIWAWKVREPLFFSTKD